MKPCVMLPEEKELTWKFDDWKNYVENDVSISWEEYQKKYCDYCKNIGVEPEDYCESFNLIKNEQ